MLRDDWKFDYSAKDLAATSTKKRDHHKERVNWWISKKNDVMNEVKESGIEVSESVAAEYSQMSNKTRGFGPQVMVRADLQNKLTEIHNKIISHEEKTKEYEGWRQVLTALSPDKRLELNSDDYLFFFGE